MGDLYLQNPRGAAGAQAYEGSASVPALHTVDPVSEDEIKQYLVTHEKATPDLAARVAAGVSANPRAPSSLYYAKLAASARKQPAPPQPQAQPARTAPLVHLVDYYRANGYSTELAVTKAHNALENPDYRGNAEDIARAQQWEAKRQPAPQPAQKPAPLQAALAKYVTPPAQPQQPQLAPESAAAITRFGIDKATSLWQATGLPIEAATQIVANLYSPHLQELAGHGPMRVPPKQKPTEEAATAALSPEDIKAFGAFADGGDSTMANYASTAADTVSNIFQGD